MKKIFIAAITGLTILSFSCKKVDSADNSSPGIDSTKIFSRGFKPSTFTELNALGFVEDLDSSTIQQNFWVPEEYLIPDMPPIANQHGFNACAPYAVVHGMLSRLYRPAEPGFTAAPFYVWNKLNFTFNFGVTITEVMKVLSEDGAPSNLIYPNISQLTTYTSQAQDDDAAAHTIAEYHPFKTIDRDRIKGFLFKNYPLPFGVNVDYDFMYHTKDIPLTKGRMVWKSRGTKDVDGHAMLLIGYSDALHAYRVQNSWNPDLWGENGYIWIDYDFFEQTIVKVGGIPQLFWATPMGVTTNFISNIKATTATVSGHVQTENGQTIVQRGICWSDVSKKPRVSDLKVVSGSGTGNFSGDLTALKPNTKYWVRAFATKALGLTIYGTIDSLTTAKVKVAENGQSLTPTVSFIDNTPKNFTLTNIDGTVAPSINYNLITIGNNSNSAITVTRANTANSFSIKLTGSAQGIQSTTFNIFYDSKLVQNVSASLNDSTEYYKSLVPGEWLNTWNSIFAGTTTYAFYEEDRIICYPGGNATWVEVRYYTGASHSMNTALSWNVSRQGANYYFSLGGQSGRITPTAMGFMTQMNSTTQLFTQKN